MKQFKLFLLSTIIFVNISITVYAQYTVKLRMGVIYTTVEGWAIGGLSNPNYADIFNSISAYALAQNYPNPFNPSTIINYQIPKKDL